MLSVGCTCPSGLMQSLAFFWRFPKQTLICDSSSHQVPLAFPTHPLPPANGIWGGFSHPHVSALEAPLGHWLRYHSTIQLPFGALTPGPQAPNSK